eukprot:scaffold2186_cov133-Isochrysis_galbana.AAC.4
MYRGAGRPRLGRDHSFLSASMLQYPPEAKSVAVVGVQTSVSRIGEYKACPRLADMARAPRPSRFRRSFVLRLAPLGA